MALHTSYGLTLARESSVLFIFALMTLHTPPGLILARGLHAINSGGAIKCEWLACLTRPEQLACPRTAGAVDMCFEARTVKNFDTRVTDMSLRPE
ncbi:hypothetical protein ACH5RR_035445 [Cinchona calisaya]|uniref:Secreted protein n=1 Tax=Cinchona calisaya TaxID=153742 RepID=A0ABD2Y2M6_9GENT